jgi:hypothetical protein
MNWDALTAVATAFTGCIIAITTLVGVYQLRQLREQRRDTAAIELMRSLQDTAFARAFLLILSLPAEMSEADARKHSSEVEEAAQILAFRFETIGLLVYRGTISFDVVEDLVGGAVVSIWYRLKDVTLRTREEKDWPMYCEWFQWLAEQFEKRGRLSQVPAHERLTEWSPQTPLRPTQ